MAKRRRSKDTVLKTVGDNVIGKVATEVHLPTLIPSSKNPEISPVANVVTRTNLTSDNIRVRFQSLTTGLSSLTSQFDDLTKQFGVELYDKMMTDSEVAASVGVLVNAVSASPANITPAVTDDDSEYEIAAEATEFVAYCFDTMDTPLQEVIEQLGDGLWQGSALARIVYRKIENQKIISKFPNLGKKGYPFILGLRDIRKKPLCSYTLVADSMNSVVGAMPVMRNGITYPFASIVPIQEGNNDIQHLVPRKDIVLFTWNPTENDPRGRSILRPAYSPWWAKTQAWYDWMQYLQQYAKPSIWGTPPDGAQPECDENGNTITPVESLLAGLQNLQNRYAAAFAHGTEVHKLEMVNGGHAFAEMVMHCNREIIRSILNQHLATGESEHSSRAQSETHQDTLSLKIMNIKNKMANRLRNDVARRLVELNYGEEYVHLTPNIDLGLGDGFPISLDSITKLVNTDSLQNGWHPDDSQWGHIERQFGLPPKKLEATKNRLIKTAKDEIDMIDKGAFNE